jgi:hypothetical protein
MRKYRTAAGLPRLARGCGPALSITYHLVGLIRREVMSGRSFAIKTEVADPDTRSFAFDAQKTMYGGKHIAEGDTIFVFASENEGGCGLVARGVVTSASPTPKRPGIARQTPRVSITVKGTALAKRRLGRSELKRFSDWDDGRPETELNFKFYRQATNKIVGISDEAAAFLRRFFRAQGKLRDST